MIRTLLLITLLAFTCSNDEVDVIVIGAGVSGTTAAKTLAKAGLKVQVFEGRNRKGGRIYTDSTVFGYPVDFGAAWIHGKVGNPVYTNAVANATTLLKFDFDDAGYLSTTIKLKDDTTTDDKYYAVGDAFRDYLEKYTDKLEDDEDVSVSVVYNAYVPTLPPKSKTETLVYLNNYLYFEFEGDFASKIENLSGKNFDTEERAGGDFLPIGGYWNLFEANSIHNNIKYELNSKVIEINQVNSKPYITLADGTKHYANYILVTVPLGVLKKKIITFNPPLSEEKQHVINSLGFGTLEKVVVEFEKTFWDNEYSLFKILESPVKFLSYVINYCKISGKKTLIFLVAGEDKYYSSYYKATEEDFKNQIIATLSPLFPKATIKIKKVYWTKWHEDPFSFGSYSSYNVNSSSEMVDEFSKNEGSVYFAGEHTHKKDFETVAGAYGSGIRAAKQIIEAENEN